MKTITIGRDANCTICINDERISRRHALLKIHNTGKMEIVDMSSNGTYVNGIKIAKNVPVPVTRKNNIVFGHARQLDWSDVPDPTKPIKIVALSLLGLILIAVAVMFFAKSCDRMPEYDGGSSSLEGDITETSVPSNSKEGISSTEPSSTKPDRQERDVIQPETEQTSDAQAKDTTKKSDTWYHRELQKEAQRRAAAEKAQRDSATQTKKKVEKTKPKEEDKKNSKPRRIY
ncbi:MAG: FHA domain-containing protein [Bacteroidaceae bacterium]|nr:FHA domain-containing protein [Bacteroidaceae bacterium]